MKKYLLTLMTIVLIFSMMIPAYCEEIIVDSLENGKEGIKFADSNLEKVIRVAINKPEGSIFPEEVKKIKKLHAKGKGISSLIGIEYLVNLEELLLSENNIKDISPIIGLEKLKYLNLWRNNISDITPLKNLNNLTSLDLDSNEISNIEALTDLHKLKALRLGSNRLTDISSLSDLNNLESLSLWSNKITDITSLSNLTNLAELKLAYNEIQDISPLVNLNNLHTLNLNNNKIISVNPLSNLINLKKVYLMNNGINDITPLSKLVNIERVRLDNNNIIDIKDLQSLKNLKLLTVSENKISDISPLKEMNKLEYLDLKSNEIIDINGIEGINNLVKLFLDENNINSVDALSDKDKLITLTISKNNIQDISQLSSLKNLKYLDLDNNNIQNLEYLNVLTNLTSLYLSNNNITNIEAITNLTNLTNLDLSNNRIFDIGFLKQNQNLKTINLYNNYISDYSSLYTLKNLDIIKTIDYRETKEVTDISGKVLDLYNDEFKGLDTYVTLINLETENNNNYTAVADKHGEFEIKGVISGEYKIVFTKKGYKPLSMYKTISPDYNKINVELWQTSDTNWINNETERIVYHYKDGIEISKAEINFQNKRLREIEKFFGLEINDKINYYICKYPEEIYELAYDTEDFYALGTYKASTNSIYSIGKAFDYHETTHAVEHKFNPNYNIPLGEGLAIYFGSYEIGSPIVLNRHVDDLAIELMMKKQIKDIKTLLKGFNGGNDYIANASFVKYLLEEHSAQQFKDLFKALPKELTDEDIEKIFMDIYNKSVKEIQSDWLKYLENKLN